MLTAAVSAANPPLKTAASSCRAGFPFRGSTTPSPAPVPFQSRARMPLRPFRLPVERDHNVGLVAYASFDC